MTFEICLTDKVMEYTKWREGRREQREGEREGGREGGKIFKERENCYF